MAQIDQNHGVPLRNVLGAYENILAATVIKTLPGTPIYEVFGSTMRVSFRADNGSSGIVNKTRPTSLVTPAADLTHTLFHDDTVSISCLYSQILALSVRLSAL